MYIYINRVLLNFKIMKNKENKKQQLPSMKDYLKFIQKKNKDNNMGWSHSVYYK